MFAEVKAMLPVSGDDYDGEIITQIRAAALDLTTSAEIVLPGEISITRTWTPPVIDQQTGKETTPGYWTVTDNSTLTDELVITTIAIWCNMRIGNPPNYEQLREAYKSMKGQMRISHKYTTYEGQAVTE